MEDILINIMKNTLNKEFLYKSYSYTYIYNKSSIYIVNTSK